MCMCSLVCIFSTLGHSCRNISLFTELYLLRRWYLKCIPTSLFKRLDILITNTSDLENLDNLNSMYLDFAVSERSFLVIESVVLSD